MVTDRKILLENLRAFKTMADCTQWGIPLHDTFPLIEEECEDSSLRPKFEELVETILKRQVIPQDEDWSSNHFLRSTKELLTLALYVSPVEFFMNPATDLIRIKIRYEQGLVKDRAVEVCDFYLLTLLNFKLNLKVALKCLKQEIPSLAPVKSLEQMSLSDFTLGELVGENASFVSTEVRTVVSNLKLDGNLQEFEEVETLRTKRKQALSQLLSFEDFAPEGPDQRALFYRAVSQALKSGKYINEIFEPGFAKITDSQFKQDWKKISEDLLVDPEQGLASLDHSSLSTREKLYFRSGMTLGSLDKILDALADSIENPY